MSCPKPGKYCVAVMLLLVCGNAFAQLSHDPAVSQQYANAFHQLSEVEIQLNDAYLKQQAVFSNSTFVTTRFVQDTLNPQDIKRGSLPQVIYAFGKHDTNLALGYGYMIGDTLHIHLMIGYMEKEIQYKIAGGKVNSAYVESGQRNLHVPAVTSKLVLSDSHYSPGQVIYGMVETTTGTVSEPDEQSFRGGIFKYRYRVTCFFRVKIGSDPAFGGMGQGTTSK